MTFLGSFLNEWWDAISKFFRGLNGTVQALLIALLAIITLLCLVRFLKPFYSADKNKIKPAPLILAVLFGGLTALVCCAIYA